MDWLVENNFNKKGDIVAKIIFHCDSGANVYSCKKSRVFDTVKDLGMEEGEWEEMSSDDKWKEAELWANENLDIGFTEV